MKTLFKILELSLKQKKRQKIKKIITFLSMIHELPIHKIDMTLC